MNEKILITGGAGFIGTRLSNHLVSLGHSVRVLDNLSFQVHDKDISVAKKNLKLSNEVEFILGDVLDTELMKKAIRGVNSIVHLASETGTGQSMYEIGKYASVNVSGTGTLLDAISSSKLEFNRIILSSTRAVYGEGKYLCEIHGEVSPQSRSFLDISRGIFDPRCDVCSSILKPCPTDEISKLVPNSIYGITKLAQEQLVTNFGLSRNLPVFAFRLQNVYGPGQSLSNPYTGIMSIFSTRILNGGDIKLFEDGLMTRDFIYIDDVVQMISKAFILQNDEGGAINIGSSKATSVESLLIDLQRELGKNVGVIKTGTYRVGDIRHNSADMTKYNRMFGEFETTSLATGLKKFINWVKTQPLQNDNYESSLQELVDQKILK